MKNNILIIAFLSSILLANDCPDEFSPDKFVNSSDYLEDLIETNFVEVGLFGTKREYEKLGFIQKKRHFYKPESYTTFMEYKYPKEMGFWSYKLDSDDKVYEVNIAQLESGREDPLALANMITNDFEGPWRDWEGDAYENYLIPEFSRIKYKEYYLSLKVILWGIEGDATKVERTTINYQIIDFTDEVNDYKRCAATKSIN